MAPSRLASMAPLALGPRLRIWPPVVLAPMAGVTNYPYRKICCEFGAGLCVSEMVSSRGILDSHRGTWRLVHFGSEESPRSIQIFGNDARAMGEAARRLRDELGVDHIDVNFGCPVPKLTRKGMGAAALCDAVNSRRVVEAVIRAAEPVPVTIKTRLGMDEDRITFLEAGRIAEESGCAWIALHGRTARQKYGGRARWDRICELKEAVSIPVLGNGDIFRAEDVPEKIDESGVDGVVIGRGCLGNPWLFRDLAALFAGDPVPPPPSRSEVVDVARRHFLLLREHFAGSPREAILRFRKLGCWYASGFGGAAEIRRQLQRIESAGDLEAIFEQWLAEPAPEG